MCQHLEVQKGNARVQSMCTDLLSSCLQVKAKQEEVDHKEELLAVLMERFGDSDLHPQVWVLLQLYLAPPGLPCQQRGQAPASFCPTGFGLLCLTA